MQVYCNSYMKSLTHTLQNKKRTTGGWSHILEFALESDERGPEGERIENVLSLLVSAETYRNEHNDLIARALEGHGTAEFLNLSRRARESGVAYQRTLEALNVALRRYRWGATVAGDFDGFRSALSPISTDKKGWAYMEPFIVAQLLECTKQPGEISRFRRCSECQHWFHAIRGHQQFCGEVCRRRHTAQNPEFKEKRRTYMREQYRPLQKELQVRSLASANAPRQTKGRG